MDLDVKIRDVDSEILDLDVEFLDMIENRGSDVETWVVAIQDVGSRCAYANPDLELDLKGNIWIWMWKSWTQMFKS